MGVLRERVSLRSSESIKKLNGKIEIKKFSLACINAFILHFAIANFHSLDQGGIGRQVIFYQAIPHSFLQ